MFLIDQKVCWSASDLTAAASCEYALLRTLAVRYGAAAIPEVADPLQDHIARLGDRHEATLLDGYRLAGKVIEFEHLGPGVDEAGRIAAHQRTLETLESDADTVYQPTFFDGEFFGYADFLERTDEGWLVCDAKLARSVKTPALLQLAAYADQLHHAGVPVAPVVALLLGSGERAEFPLVDLLPVLVERRSRLRALIAGHGPAAAPVQWGDDAYLACGSCPECKHAIDATDDVLLVAGLRTDQRRKLRAAGIRTMADLAGADEVPKGMSAATFAKLRSQARLQAAERSGGPATFELTEDATKTLDLLPAPSAGDLFFDFEGDPLYDEGDTAVTGLEYLWGYVDAEETYTEVWAHDRELEAAALKAFLTMVADRRLTYPDMHVYHYAPYEKSALTRLAIRHQYGEDLLDDLLRAGVFVDLYATVRGSVRVSAPSYSIKKLEPLYMGPDLRTSEVAGGGESILAYHEYRAFSASADPADREQADHLLAELADYNRYDCVSTKRLRDWLRARKDELAPHPAPVEDTAGAAEGQAARPAAAVAEKLLARSGGARESRTHEEQAFAMLAASVDYLWREQKQFWWEHFDRLARPVDDWADTRDVFVTVAGEVVEDWETPPGKRNARRIVRLTGHWGAGSGKPDRMCALYALPHPPGVVGIENADLGWGGVEKVEQVDAHTVLVTESRKVGETYDDLPCALTPLSLPPREPIEGAILGLAEAAIAADSFPLGPVHDLVARRSPRFTSLEGLPATGDPVADLVRALLDLDHSYLAVQGPPGTGKSWTGSRVIKELVEKHHWRIGVVAQSHAVVENLLAGIVGAGLDPALVGKNGNSSDAPTWTVLKDGVPPRAQFVADHAATGCVLGGTAWTFASDKLVDPAELDLLVVDEAGQFSLAATLGASVCAQRLLLLGDPQQLPQVSQGTHPEPVDQSALGWLMEGHDTLPAEHGYFLGTSFRMHPAVCAAVSALSYEGRLHAAAIAGQRSLDGVAPGVEVIRVPHAGNRTQSHEEADVVVAQVADLVGRTWTASPTSQRPLAPSDILVVAPYNAQVALVRERLAASGFAGVRVGTVDKFQGQEAPVCILTLAASSRADVARGMEFLLNRNRINVGISRAQWKAIVVRSDALTAYLPSSPGGLLELGGFLGLEQRG